MRLCKLAPALSTSSRDGSTVLQTVYGYHDRLPNLIAPTAAPVLPDFIMVSSDMSPAQGGAPSRPAKLSSRQQRDAGMARAAAAAEAAALSKAPAVPQTEADATEPELALAAVGS